jgi:hypothetical protein
MENPIHACDTASELEGDKGRADRQVGDRWNTSSIPSWTAVIVCPRTLAWGSSTTLYGAVKVAQ